MGLVVGDVGTKFQFDVVDVDSSGVESVANFNPGVDSVQFVFQFRDNSVTSRAGVFSSPSVAEYVTQAGDIRTWGKCEIQLQIVSPAWTGSSCPNFEIDVCPKLS